MKKKADIRLMQCVLAEQSFQRKVVSTEKRKAKNRAISGGLMVTRAAEETGTDDYQHIECPEELNLSTSIEETLTLFNKLRNRKLRYPKSKFFIEIENIKHISPGAALLIASALDRQRIRTMNRSNLVAESATEWNPAVRELLRQMGFLALLQVKKIETTPVQSEELQSTFLPMQSGIIADGKEAIRLRQRLFELSGSVASPQNLYAAITEAMTNTRHHAYKNPGTVQHWWLSASYDRKEQWVTIMFLDHGEGIPSTLPRTNGEFIKGLMSKLSPGLRSYDAQLIEAAMEIGRSSTVGSTRGKGLKNDIQGYIEKNHCKGMLRIISRRGHYVYERNESGNERTELVNLTNEFIGTLIEWGFKVVPDEH